MDINPVDINYETMFDGYSSTNEIKVKKALSWCFIKISIFSFVTIIAVDEVG